MLNFALAQIFFCCVCSMPVFGDILLGSFSPKTCFLFRSTMITLSAITNARDMSLSLPTWTSDRQRLKVIWRFLSLKSVNLTPFFHNNSEHDVDLTTSGPDFTLPKGGVWRVSACLRCVHNHNRCFEGGIIKIVFIFEVIVVL